MIISCFLLAWGAGDTSSGFGDAGGFENDEDGFDSFLAMQAPPTQLQVCVHSIKIESIVSIIRLSLYFTYGLHLIAGSTSGCASNATTKHIYK